MKMKRYLPRALCGLLCLLLMAALTVPAGALSLSAASACLLDCASGRVLYEQNAD